MNRNKDAMTLKFNHRLADLGAAYKKSPSLEDYIGKSQDRGSERLLGVF